MFNSKEVALEEAFKKLNKLLWVHLDKKNIWEVPQAKIGPDALEQLKEVNTLLNEYNIVMNLHTHSGDEVLTTHTKDTKKYCVKCGEALVEYLIDNKFDHNTGKQEYHLGCPKNQCCSHSIYYKDAAGIWGMGTIAHVWKTETTTTSGIFRSKASKTKTICARCGKVKE